MSQKKDGKIVCSGGFLTFGDLEVTKVEEEI